MPHKATIIDPVLQQAAKEIEQSLEQAATLAIERFEELAEALEASAVELAKTIKPALESLASSAEFTMLMEMMSDVLPAPGGENDTP